MLQSALLFEFPGRLKNCLQMEKNMIFKGFWFGLLFQIAIGPVCLFIFKIAVSSGIFPALAGVIGVTMVDAVYITLAIIGIGSFIERSRIKPYLKHFGTLVLLLFGLEDIFGSFGIHLLPALECYDEMIPVSSAFKAGLILTGSNPLTIIFWTGVFSTKIVNESYRKKEMIFFGIGAMSATLIFLGIMAVIVGSVHLFISESLIKVLNLIVGTILLGFGVKNIVWKGSSSVTGFK
jgi:threonine/homoserine/homoserine lactone efflux protein